MSQMTVSAPRLARLGGATRAATRTRAVDAAPAVRHHRFHLLCVMLVLVSFAVVLMINTARAEGSYVLGRLAAEQTAQHDRVVTLQAELTQAQSAESLVAEAKKLRMVPSTSTATLRLSDGSITGVASQVDQGRTTTVDLPSTGVAKDED